MPRVAPNDRADYRVFSTITTRWNDNDPYAHVNNVVYYEWFDTAINRYLIEHGVLDIGSGKTVGLVVHTDCDYFSPIAFPDDVQVGLRVAKLGDSSVRYEVGIFRNDEARAAAQGAFVHVYVDRATGRPVRTSDALRTALEPLIAEQSG